MRVLFSPTLIALAIPSLARAALPPANFEDLVWDVVDILESAIPALIALAALFFLFGVLKMFANGGDAKAHEEGRQIMIYGVIGLFIMVSLWGLVNLLDVTFFGAGGSVSTPTSGGGGGGGGMHWLEP